MHGDYAQAWWLRARRCQRCETPRVEEAAEGQRQVAAAAGEAPQPSRQAAVVEAVEALPRHPVEGAAEAEALRLEGAAEAAAEALRLGAAAAEAGEGVFHLQAEVVEVEVEVSLPRGAAEAAAGAEAALEQQRRANVQEGEGSDVRTVAWLMKISQVIAVDVSTHCTHLKQRRS